METKQNDVIEIDIQDLFFACLQRIWMIIVTTGVGVVAAALITTLAITPKYDSSSMIYIMNQGTNLSSLSLADLQVGSALTNDYMVLVKSRPVLNKVISNLKLDMSYEELSNSITMNNPDNTRILTITVKSTDPYMAKTIVDEVTNVAVKRTAEIMDTTKPSIVEEGTVDTKQISPSLKKNIIIGGLLGFLLAIAMITVSFLLNDSVRSSEDVEKYLGLNTLGVIPMEEGTTRAKMMKRDKEEDKRQKNHALKKKKSGKETR